jgi:hypothetical protein
MHSAPKRFKFDSREGPEQKMAEKAGGRFRATNNLPPTFSIPVKKEVKTEKKFDATNFRQQTTHSAPGAQPVKACYQATAHSAPPVKARYQATAHSAPPVKARYQATAHSAPPVKARYQSPTNKILLVSENNEELEEVLHHYKTVYFIYKNETVIKFINTSFAKKAKEELDIHKLRYNHPPSEPTNTICVWGLTDKDLRSDIEITFSKFGSASVVAQFDCAGEGHDQVDHVEK